jgi:mRNA-degrading endonuclease toxin of MazEF toxin-antitoxin module
LQRKRSPLRGEIWWIKLPTDHPGKGGRPVIIASVDARNQHERADTILVVPLSTSIHKESPTHTYLASGETGLQEQSVAQAENITVVRKESLLEPRGATRQISASRVCEIAAKVKLAMGCL